MKYDFTSILDRAGHDALAVDALGKIPGMSPEAPEPGFDFIPMWVADMNFPVVPTVQTQIIARVSQPHFGYFDAAQVPGNEYYSKIIAWQKARNGVEGLEQKHIGYENGVLGGVASTLRAFAGPGDAVLVHSPTYIGFTHTLEDNGYKIVLSPLVQDEHGTWRMDYDDMEQKLAENHCHVAIFCSPHNPTGRVWDRAEIERAMQIYAKHDCIVISDEIWSDIILPGTAGESIATDASVAVSDAAGTAEGAVNAAAAQAHGVLTGATVAVADAGEDDAAVAAADAGQGASAAKPIRKHVPTQSISEDARNRTVALYAPSKTFNLAGLVGSYHIIYNDYLRDRVVAESRRTHYNEMNVLSMHGLLGAYEPAGYEWVDELCQVIQGNVDYACDYIDQHFEGVSVARPQGTYMLFVDCTDWCAAHGKDIDWVQHAAWRVGVGIQDGRPFHGPCHIRVNLALPLSRVQEAFNRLDKYVFNAAE